MRLALALAGVLMACNSSESIFGVSTPGLPARVELHIVQAAGGHVTEVLITIDSAQSTYFAVTCEGGATSQCSSMETRSGGVATALLQRLFGDAQRSEFRELKSRERGRGDLTPPDGGWSRLTVVTGERTKILSWDVSDVPPQILQDYVCLVRAASETFPLCD
jgi:hypothetical protein